MLPFGNSQIKERTLMYILIMDVKKIFAERLKELREEKAISLKELSKAIGVSDVALCRWENGKRVPTIESLVKIATYFGVSTDYLTGLED